MPIAGEVYDLGVKAYAGPWAQGKRHPGVVINNVGDAVVVVPMTSARPRVIAGAFVFELTEKAGSIDPPLWVYCDCLLSLPKNLFNVNDKRGVLSKGDLAAIRHQVARVVGAPL